MDDETVKLHIIIRIDQDDPEADTGVSLARWNAMTDRERSRVVRDLWEGMVSRDSGGIRVVTPGAKEI